MTDKLASTSSKALANVGDHSPIMSKLNEEMTIVPGIDKEYQYQMRKLGTIHLGVRVKATTRAGKSIERPKATEYFVLPESLLTDKAFRAKLESMGQNPDKPHALPVMFVSDDIDMNIVRCRELWGTGGKLKCRTTPINMPDKSVQFHTIWLDPATQDYAERTCNDTECASCNDCKWITKIRFVLPDQKRFGYWEITTASQNNKGALSRELFDVKQQGLGRIAGIDLTLVLINERVMHPLITGADGNKSRIETKPYLMHIEAPETIREMMVRNSCNNVEVVESDELDEAPLVEADYDDAPAPTEEVVTEAAPQTEIDDEYEIAQFTHEPVDDREALKTVIKGWIVDIAYRPLLEDVCNQMGVKMPLKCDMSAMADIVARVRQAKGENA